MRKNILMQRMVMTWNSLPTRVEEVETINNYKENWMGIWGVSNRNADEISLNFLTPCHSVIRVKFETRYSQQDSKSISPLEAKS